jgi:transmembrane sensor
MREPTTNDEAARWAVRLQEAQLSADEQRELDAWLAAAAHHPGALIRARAVWLNLGRLGAIAGPTMASPAVAGPTTIPSSEPQAPVIAATAPRTASPAANRRRVAIALAASIVGAAVIALGFKSSLLGGAAYETGVGEVRRIALDDGSAITLNSDSRAAVRFDKSQRTIRLERGEALFEVAKDRSRPFTVQTGEVSVLAIGTTFAVRTLPDVVTVSVTEGVVEVAGRESPPQRITINEQASVQPRSAVRVTPEDQTTMTRRLAWRSGLLSFSGESLADAVHEVNRYSRRQIKIDDPALAAKPVIGIFRIGDVDAFAQATAAALDAEVRADGEVVRLTAIRAQ